MANQPLAFVIKRVYIFYLKNAWVVLAVAVVCIPISFVIQRYHKTLRLFFVCHAVLALKAAQYLAFCVVLSIAQPVIHRSLEHLIQYHASTFCLKCYVFRVSPSVSSTQLVLSNPQFATISSAATRASFNSMLAGVKHSTSCSANKVSLPSRQTQTIMLYQKQQKSSDLLTTRKTFFATAVPIKSCSALPVCRSSKVAVQSSLPSDEMEKFTKLIPKLDDLAKLGVPIDQTFPTLKSLYMEVNIAKASTPEEREQLYVSACWYIYAKMGEIEAAKKQNQEIHDFEMREREQKLLLEKQAHDQKLLSEKALEQRLAAQEKRLQEIHDVEMQERKNLCTAIKKASSQQNLSTQNIAPPCEDSNKEEQKHEE